jgi:diketogulonate reductase-like aldo/keto reductase
MIQFKVTKENKEMADPMIALSDSNSIPQLGFGTWLNKDEAECINSVKCALEAGYRHIDTAQIYGNEHFVGQALQESEVPRDEIFITTKIWNENLYWDDIIPSFDESLKKLRTDYVDLLLIHFPVTELRRPAWRRMEDILASGKARSIGVSNYTITHLEELLRETNVKPVVNQVEMHVFLQQAELVKYCKEQNIAIEAYSPLAHGRGIENTVLTRIAKKYHKSNAQVMIRWCLQQGFITMPKSVHAELIKQNFDVFDFELGESDLTEIKGLNSDLRTCWDPTHVA